MAGSTQDDLSPWTSGSWHFDPKELTVVSHPKGRGGHRSQKGSNGRQKRAKGGRFGLLPEHEMLRLGYIALFAFSGFVLALVAILLMT